MSDTRRNWSFEEVSAALTLYLKTDFGKIHKGNPEIIALANVIQRTPSAVALKLSNLAALDETIPQKGMANASAMDRTVWSQFLSKPFEVIDTSLTLQRPEKTNFELREGRDRFVATTARQGQSFFREMVLTGYNRKCALTGISDPSLLNASHIVGWAEDESNRLNPRNGLCLNALHDRAFDRHLISFDDESQMIISRRLSEKSRDVLKAKTSGKLAPPARFKHDPAFMLRHREVFLNLQG